MHAFRPRPPGRRATRAGWLSMFLLAAIFVSPSGGVASSAEARDEREYLVILREQANLEPLREARVEPGSRRAKAWKGTGVVERLRATAARSQRSLRVWLTSRGVEHRPFWVSNMVWVRCHVGVRDELRNRPDVERVVPNARLTRPSWIDPLDVPRSAWEDESSGARRFVEWNIDLIGAPLVWADGVTGSGVVVGSIDTGIDWEHPALLEQYRGWNGGAAAHDYHWWDAVDVGGGVCGPATSEPCDPDGHGTAVLGAALGDDGDGNQVGVAPQAEWIGCRAWDESEGSSLALVSECLQWMLAPTDLDGSNPSPELAPDVINNSWICEPDEGCADPLVLESAVANLRAAGIVVVSAAGNDGSGCSTIDDPPAIYADALTVGSSNIDDQLSFFSSRGPVIVDGSSRRKPDLCAPGQNVRSSELGGGYQNGLSGTSMAAPHVAGTVALMISANQELRGQVQAIESILESTALPISVVQTCGGTSGAEFPNNMVGHGRLDAFGAYLDALAFSAADAPAPAPPAAVRLSATPNPSSGVVRLRFHALTSGALDLRIFDASGRSVWVAAANPSYTGTIGEIEWDGRDASGRPAASGAYFARLRVGAVSETVPLIVTR